MLFAFKTIFRPPISRAKPHAKPHALYVDPLILNAVFKFETLFLILILFLPAASQWSPSGSIPSDARLPLHIVSCRG